MLKKVLYVVVSLVLIVAILFIIPVKKKSFSAYFQGDEEVEKALSDFRKQPLKSLSFQHQDWEYMATGKGEKTLLFVHGMGGAYDIWFQQITSLKNDFRILSITVPEVHSLEAATKGILNILDNQRIDKVTFIGTSMGGYIGQYFLKTNPNRLEKLVLGNTFPPNDFYRQQNGKMRKIVPFLPEWLIMKNFRDNASEKVFPASDNSELLKAYLLEQYSGLMSKQQFIGRFDMVLEHFEINENSQVMAVPKLITDVTQ